MLQLLGNAAVITEPRLHGQTFRGTSELHQLLGSRRNSFFVVTGN